MQALNLESALDFFFYLLLNHLLNYLLFIIME